MLTPKSMETPAPAGTDAVRPAHAPVRLDLPRPDYTGVQSFFQALGSAINGAPRAAQPKVNLASIDDPRDLPLSGDQPQADAKLLNAIQNAPTVPMRPCITCGRQTTGSFTRGSEVRAPMICQPCRDAADAEAEASLVRAKMNLDRLLNPTPAAASTVHLVADALEDATACTFEDTTRNSDIVEAIGRLVEATNRGDAREIRNAEADLAELGQITLCRQCAKPTPGSATVTRQYRRDVCRACLLNGRSAATPLVRFGPGGDYTHDYNGGGR